MNVCQYALVLEGEIQQEVIQRIKNGPNNLLPLIETISTFQNRLTDLLIKTVDQKDSAYHYPDSETIQALVEIIDKDKSKCIISDDITPEAITNIYINLSIITNLVEKSLQFYNQAALNSTYEYEKIFFSSIAEIKKVLKRRLDSTLRVVYNSLWSKIGFAPFMFGKE